MEGLENTVFSHRFELFHDALFGLWTSSTEWATNKMVLHMSSSASFLALLVSSRLIPAKCSRLFFLSLAVLLPIRKDGPFLYAVGGRFTAMHCTKYIPGGTGRLSLVQCLLSVLRTRGCCQIVFQRGQLSVTDGRPRECCVLHWYRTGGLAWSAPKRAIRVVMSRTAKD